MSDPASTPLTDAKVVEIQTAHGPREYVPADVAREIERRLYAAQKLYVEAASRLYAK